MSMTPTTIRQRLGARRRRGARTAVAATAAVACLGGLGLVSGAGSAAAGAGPGDGHRDRLYVVVLHGPGTAGHREGDAATAPLAAFAMALEQSRLLAEVGSPDPVYRWTSALNGFAARLSSSQAATLRADSAVALVEPNRIRPLAAAPAAAIGALGAAPRQGGAGRVIAVIDTGISPENPLFAGAATAPQRRFAGICQTGERWSRDDCNGKVVGARYFVSGFGADALRSAALLSPRDTDGHGTQMASLAAGNARVPVRVAGERLGRFSGQAPDAALAVYKACWSAPDPADDGCANADLVAAIDQATRDGVDVVSLSVGGPGEIDAVELALLGATEGGSVVVAAAGSRGPDGATAHPAPWVTTVGATSEQPRRGRVVLGDGPRLVGAMLSRAGLPQRRLVDAAELVAPGARIGDARACVPGSLDARAADDVIVVCRRGVVPRVEKSRAVALADGVGMVLVNERGSAVAADVHRVPTVHLGAGEGRLLLHWMRRNDDARAALRSIAPRSSPARVARWSAGGDLSSGFLKPDVVAPGAGVLAAVPAGRESAWDFVTGSSAATAHTAGVAAALLGSGLSPEATRSALVTAARPVPGPALRSGAGRVAPARRLPGLTLEVPVESYRAWWDGGRGVLNTTAVVLTDGVLDARRQVTAIGRGQQTYSATVVGTRHAVTVSPTTLTLRRGERAAVTISALAPAGGRVDTGWIEWRGSDGSLTRVPIVLAR
ncbi:S8 family serine peptidase [Nocardioides sp. R-C-SC26]|uniref:S8 family serine peptidase n=1 Tax=Nocardioides sp. R-C-SC26 TaxID=2870414 RepID=UPI001E438006|nr:S8 family serine peptidase [Nocardioides sp. R-C-SC26]